MREVPDSGCGCSCSDIVVASESPELGLEGSPEEDRQLIGSRLHHDWQDSRISTNPFRRIAQ